MIWRWLARLGALAILAFLAGLGWFAVDLRMMPLDPPGEADAIVVLTGGTQRLERGIALLEAGKGKKLFISGVHPGVDADSLLRAAHAGTAPESGRIVLGHDADNTEGNARETAAWLRHEGYDSFRLVTANYHLRRAMLEFRRVLPSSVSILPVPVQPEPAPSHFWPWRGWSHVVVVEYVKLLGALGRAALAPRPVVPA